MMKLILFLLLAVAVDCALSQPATTTQASDRSKPTVNQQLILACFEVDAEAALRFLGNGADANARWGNANAKLMSNSSGGYPMAAKYYTPLIALASGDAPGDRVRIAKALITAGAKLDLNDGFGATALHEACYLKHAELVLFLIAQGAEVNTRVDIYIDGTYDESPLHRAIGQPEVVKALINAGARLDVRNSTGDTPLHWAARYHNLECVKLLLDAGAWPSATNRRGKDPEATEGLRRSENTAEINRILREARTKK